MLLDFHWWDEVTRKEEILGDMMGVCRVHAWRIRKESRIGNLLPMRNIHQARGMCPVPRHNQSDRIVVTREGTQQTIVTEAKWTKHAV